MVYSTDPAPAPLPFPDDDDFSLGQGLLEDDGYDPPSSPPSSTMKAAGTNESAQVETPKRRKTIAPSEYHRKGENAMEPTFNTVTITVEEYDNLVDAHTRLQILKEIRRKNVKSSLKYTEPMLTGGRGHGLRHHRVYRGPDRCLKTRWSSAPAHTAMPSRTGGRLCPQCQAHLYAGERVYGWGRRLTATLPQGGAQRPHSPGTALSGESLAYTRQQMELDHSAWDELLGIESREWKMADSKIEVKTHWKKHFNPEYIGAYAFMPARKRPSPSPPSTGRWSRPRRPQGGVQHPVLRRAGKALILNVTNAKMIAKLLRSSYMEDWVGHASGCGTVSAFGERVGRPRQAASPGTEQRLHRLRPGGRRQQNLHRGADHPGRAQPLWPRGLPGLRQRAQGQGHPAPPGGGSPAAGRRCRR